MKYKVCTHCVMDSSDRNLVLDENGVCERCREYESSILPSWNHGEGHEEELRNLIANIKRKGEGKAYDCILGLSGGLDSCYMLHLAVTQWGLRPYVFHIDAGWNLPVAMSNITKMCDKLGVELHVEKMDWEEMRQMQLAFFRAGHAALDAPQDHSFIAVAVDGGADVVLTVLIQQIRFDGAQLLLDLIHQTKHSLLDGLAVHIVGIIGRGDAVGHKGVDEVQLEAIDIVVQKEAAVDGYDVSAHVGIAGI